MLKIDVESFLAHNDIELGNLGDSEETTAEKQARSRLMSNELADISLCSSTEGESRVRGVRYLVTSVSLHMVLISSLTLWMMFSNALPQSRLILVSGMLAAGFSGYGINKNSGRLSSGLVLVGFASFTTGIAFGLCLLGTFISREFLIHMLVQLVVACGGLCLYAWTTKYEGWSQIEERVFSSVPCVFVTLVMWLVLSSKVLPLVTSSTATLLWSLTLAECTKDSIIPARSTDQLLTDVVCIHLSTMDRLKFVALHRLRRAYQKVDIF